MRQREIIKMREAGMTFAQIGEKLGLSRQRVHQIYHKPRESLWEKIGRFLNGND